jgi:hypothetical protein
MLAAQFRFNVRAIFADLRKRQTALGSRLVSPESRAEPTAKADNDCDLVSPKSTPVETTQAS